MVTRPDVGKSAMGEHSSFELRKFVTPEVVFGVGARSLAGRYCQNFSAEHALLVTDPGVVAAGWADEVATSLEQAGISYSVYASVSCNPRTGEAVKIKASKTVGFKPAKALKDSL